MQENLENIHQIFSHKLMLSYHFFSWYYMILKLYSPKKIMCLIKTLKLQFLKTYTTFDSKWWKFIYLPILKINKFKYLSIISSLNVKWLSLQIIIYGHNKNISRCSWNFPLKLNLIDISYIENKSNKFRMSCEQFPGWKSVFLFL